MAKGAVGAVKGGAKGVGNTLNRGKNYFTLNKVLDSDNVAVLAPSGGINASKVCGSACDLKPTNDLERNLIDDIITNGDDTGIKTERCPVRTAVSCPHCGH